LSRFVSSINLKCLIVFIFSLVSSLIFGICMSLSPFNLFKFILWVVLIDCIGVGLLIASIYWYIANKFLLKNPKSNLDVEWAYCFDVHLNAFLPLLTVLHVFQLPFLMSEYCSIFKSLSYTSLSFLKFIFKSIVSLN